MDEKELRKSVERLAQFHTRNSLSKDANEAAQWLKEQLIALGCTNPTFKAFKSGYSPNVVCTIESTNKVSWDWRGLWLAHKRVSRP